MGQVSFAAVNVEFSGLGRARGKTCVPLQLKLWVSYTVQDRSVPPELSAGAVQGRFPSRGAVTVALVVS